MALKVNMLSDPASVTEETVDIHAYGVRHARFSRPTRTRPR